MKAVSVQTRPRLKIILHSEITVKISLEINRHFSDHVVNVGYDIRFCRNILTFI